MKARKACLAEGLEGNRRAHRIVVDDQDLARTAIVPGLDRWSALVVQAFTTSGLAQDVGDAGQAFGQHTRRSRVAERSFGHEVAKSLAGCAEASEQWKADRRSRPREAMKEAA